MELLGHRLFVLITITFFLQKLLVCSPTYPKLDYYRSLKLWLADGQMSYLLVVLFTFLVISSEVIGHLHFFFYGLPIYVLNLFFIELLDF